MLEAAEKAYDEIAEREGIDEHGDEIVDVAEDDESALQTTEEIVDDDEIAGEEPTRSEEQEAVEPQEAQEAGTEERGEAGSGELRPPPHTWSQEWKDAYNKITDPTVREAVHQTMGNMNKAFSQRMTEFAQAKRENEGLRNAMTPHVNRLQRAGLTPEMAVSRALGWDQYIQQDPVKGLLDYGKALGVDLAAAVQEQQKANTQYLTPTERAIQEQNEALAARIEATERNYAQWQAQNAQADATQRQAKAVNMLQHFMNAKDSAGNLTHPHVEMVAPMMTRLIENGVTADLEEAYQMAAANNPDLRRARENTRKAQQVRESQRKAKKVRQASRSGIVAKGTSRGQPKAARSTESQVSAAYDKIANG